MRTKTPIELPGAKRLKELSKWGTVKNLLKDRRQSV